jgi:tRNA-uridine 2-sulfurtransferase
VQVGRHVGLSFYTLGQRQGLGIGGRAQPGLAVAPAAGEVEHQPWYVAHKDLPHNILRVVQGHAHPALLSTQLWAEDCSWVAGTAPSAGMLAAKTRYRQADAACQFTAEENAGFALQFNTPQWAVTPGQSAVLYDAEVCLGGGVIQRSDALDSVPGLALAFTAAGPESSPKRGARRGPARRPVPSR